MAGPIAVHDRDVINHGEHPFKRLEEGSAGQDDGLRRVHFVHDLHFIDAIACSRGQNFGQTVVLPDPTGDRDTITNRNSGGYRAAENVDSGVFILHIEIGFGEAVQRVVVHVDNATEDNEFAGQN